MVVIYGVVQYFLAVFILLTLYFIIGASVLRILNIKGRMDRVYNALVSPVVGVGFITITTALMASMNIAISTSNTALIFGTTVVFALILKWFSEKKAFVKSTRQLGTPILFFALAAFVGLLPYLQLMIKSEFPAGFGTSATWTNNDLGPYLQMATNVARSGFADSQLVSGWNAGMQASFDHPGAQTFLAAASQMLHRDPFQMGIVVMASVVGSFLLAMFAALKRLSANHSNKWDFILAVAIIVNPAVFSIVANFFFAQVLSMTLLMGLLALSIPTGNEILSKRETVLISIIFFAVFLASSEIALLLLPVTVFLPMLISKLKTVPRLFVRQTLSLVSVGLMIRLISGSLITDQVDVLRRNTGSGVAGWTSNLLSPTALLGFVPTQLGGPYSTATRFFDVISIAVFIFLTCLFIYKKRLNSISLFGQAFLSLIVLIAVKKWGIDGYQTWKLVVTVVPFFAVFLWSLRKSDVIPPKVPIRQYLSILVVGATISWIGFVWRDSTPTSIVNPNVAEVARSEATRRQDGVNLLLAPFFETMALSVIPGIPTQMMSPSYQFPSGQETKFTCTLTTKNNLTSLRDTGPIVHQRGDYVLVGTPKCK